MVDRNRNQFSPLDFESNLPSLKCKCGAKITILKDTEKMVVCPNCERAFVWD